MTTTTKPTQTNNKTKINKKTTEYPPHPQAKKKSKKKYVKTPIISLHKRVNIILHYSKQRRKTIKTEEYFSSGTFHSG